MVNYRNRESGTNPEFINSNSLYDYGYFRLVSECPYDPFSVIEADEFGGTAEHYRIVRELLGIPKEAVPLEIECPRRPESDFSYEEMELSVGELAGACAFLRLLNDRSSVVFSGGDLGAGAEDVFKINSVQQKIRDKTAEDVVWSRNSGSRNGSPQVEALLFLTSEDLFNKFGIQFERERDLMSVKLGSLWLKIERQAALASVSETTRSDVHLLSGLCKMMMLYATLERSKYISLYLENRPLGRFWDEDGIQPLDRLIAVDRIRSYMV